MCKCPTQPSPGSLKNMKFDLYWLPVTFCFSGGIGGLWGVSQVTNLRNTNLRNTNNTCLQILCYCLLCLVISLKISCIYIDFVGTRDVEIVFPSGFNVLFGSRSMLCNTPEYGQTLLAHGGGLT